MKRNLPIPGSAHGAVMRAVMVGLCLAVWELAFNSGSGHTAFGGTVHFDSTALPPAMQQKVRAALLKVKKSPGDISAIETLLAIEPGVTETVGTNRAFASSDPLRNEALKWCQSLQPAEVLAASLEKGSNAAVHWALGQIVWRRSNGWFSRKSLARLLPGIERALVNERPATRAQAVEAMLVCLPLADRARFLKGMLKGQPDEVIAAVIEALANDLRQSDPEVDFIVDNWLRTSEDPLLLRACCSYWWLVKGQSSGDVEDEDMASFERIAGHPDASVRNSVALAVSELATPIRPRLVAILLRLTTDQDSLVSCDAVRALRNANTPEVNARLREMFAADQPPLLRRAAIEVLGIFGKDNLPLISSAAKADKDLSVRLWAVYALRRIGTPEAGAALEVVSHDPDADVRKEAQTQHEWFRKEHPEKP